MRSNRAAAVMSVLIYSQALLGFAAVVAVLMKAPAADRNAKPSTAITSVETTHKSARTAG